MVRWCYEKAYTVEHDPIVKKRITSDDDVEVVLRESYYTKSYDEFSLKNKIVIRRRSSWTVH